MAAGETIQYPQGGRDRGAFVELAPSTAGRSGCTSTQRRSVTPQNLEEVGLGIADIGFRCCGAVMPARVLRRRGIVLREALVLLPT